MRSAILSLVATISLIQGLNTEAATRVALINGERRDAAANAVELATATLSADANVELLDREEIRKVLAEQKLTQSGLVDATQVIAIGKLLKTDLFAVVDGAADKDAVPGIVVFDAQTGLRYWDGAIQAPTAELDRMSDAIVKAVQSSIRKRSRQKQGLQTVGFVTVRNADLPRTQDALCETVGFLVERTLPRSPDIAVLERRRLERVNEERSLPGVGESVDLLASLVTIELEISRGNNGRGLRATALIKSTGQANPERVIASVAEFSAVVLAEELSEKLIAFLHAAPAAANADRTIEAKRFDNEATHHYSHLRYADTVRAEEAALALDPSHEDYGERLALYLIRYATYLFSPAQLNHVKGGDRAWTDVHVEPQVLDSLLTAATRSVEINMQSKRFSAHQVPYNMPLSYLCDRLRGLRRTSAPSAQQQIDEFLQLCLRRSLNYCESLAEMGAADPQKIDIYTSYFDSEHKLFKSASIDTAQYASCMLQTASRWIEVTKAMPPEFNKSDGGEQLNMLLNTLVGPTNWPWPADEREYALKMAPVFAAMQQHGRPIVQLYGHFGQIRGELLLGTETEDVAYEKFATVYRKLAQSMITSPNPWNPERTRFAAYEGWRTAIAEMPGKSRHTFAKREVLELCNFMMSRHDLIYKVLQQAVGSLDPKSSLDLIERVLRVADDPLCKVAANEKARVRSLLKTAEQNLLTAHPELVTTPVQLPWTDAKRLFQISDHRELTEIVGAVLANETLYGICLEFDGDQSSLRLVNVPLDGGSAKLLGVVDLGVSAAKVPAHLRRQFVPATRTDNKAIYVATNGCGIVVFPFRDGKPRRIDVQNGLPSNNVGSLDVLNGKLYAGFADGYLIAYDLEHDQCEVLASSRRKQKLSPFDDGPVFRVPTLVADPQRQRVVFAIGKFLWQLTPADGKVTQVLNLAEVGNGPSEPKLDGKTIEWTSPRRGDRVLVCNVFHTKEIDLAHDSAIEIHAPQFGVFQTHPPQLIVDGSLWSGGFFGRLSLDKRDYQSLPAPDKTATPFRPAVLLDLLADGRRVVAADPMSVWVLRLRDREPAAKTAP